jgi:hypothetical protein
MRSLWKVLLVLSICVFLWGGEASAAWVVGAPYYAPYGYYHAAAPVYAAPVYAGAPYYAAPVYAGAPIYHHYAPAPVYARTPVYYAPSAVYVRPRTYAVSPMHYYYPGVVVGY